MLRCSNDASFLMKWCEMLSSLFSHLILSITLLCVPSSLSSPRPSMSCNLSSTSPSPSCLTAPADFFTCSDMLLLLKTSLPLICSVFLEQPFDQRRKASSCSFLRIPPVFRWRWKKFGSTGIWLRRPRHSSFSFCWKATEMKKKLLVIYNLKPALMLAAAWSAALAGEAGKCNTRCCSLWASLLRALKLNLVQ